MFSNPQNKTSNMIASVSEERVVLHRDWPWGALEPVLPDCDQSGQQGTFSKYSWMHCLIICTQTWYGLLIVCNAWLHYQADGVVNTVLHRNKWDPIHFQALSECVQFCQHECQSASQPFGFWERKVWALKKKEKRKKRAVSKIDSRTSFQTAG